MGAASSPLAGLVFTIAAVSIVVAVYVVTVAAASFAGIKRGLLPRS